MADASEIRGLPPFPAALLGQRGALFAPALLDPELGPEICLLLFEPDPTWRRFLADADLGLDLSAGVERLPQGAVAFFAWSLWIDEEDLLAPFENDDAAPPRYVNAYLGLLDPHQASTRELLATAGGQERLPVVLCDSRQGRALELLEYGNDYGLDELGAAFAAEVAGEPPGSFPLAAEEFRRRHPVEELVGPGPQGEEEEEDGTAAPGAIDFEDREDDEDDAEDAETVLPDRDPSGREPF